MRALGLGEMRPLGKPEIGVAADLLTGEREGFDIGDGVDPDGFASEEASEAECEVAGGRAGGEDDVGAFAEDDEDEAEGHEEKGEFVPAGGVVDGVEAMGGDLGAIIALDGDEDGIALIEGGDDAQHLNPVAAPGSDGEDAFTTNGMCVPTLHEDAAPTVLRDKKAHGQRSEPESIRLTGRDPLCISANCLGGNLRVMGLTHWLGLPLFDDGPTEKGNT